MAENCALIPEPVTMYTQTEALRDVKDLSKNLMSGDFERQYANDITEKGSKKRKGCVIFGVTVAALVVWLLVLTIVREVQVKRLQQEVDELSANMIAMSATVKSLNEKLTNNRLFNEFKTLEDTIYADDDQDVNLVDDAIAPQKESQGSESLDKLHDLTVLEDDNQLDDDEDMYDGDESGDWYPDYDHRREKIGTTNMVRLKPDDFMENVMAPLVNLKEIKRLLNENPEIQDINIPTHPPATQPPASNRDKRSVFPDTTLESVSDFTEPKGVSKMEERRKTKKFSPSTDTLNKMALHTVSRTARNSNNEEGSPRRAFVAAHFHGNTSHLSPEIHEHYKGNGLIRVAHGAPHDVWYPSPWTAASPPHTRPTLTRTGHVNVHHTGVYLVYVQIYYLDSHDIISWVLHRTSAYMDGRDTLLQCAQSSHSSERLEKPNSCFSAAALFLKAGDRLAVRNTGGDRHSLMQPEKSFIGLIKLADAEEPNDEM
ncbi:protein eiger-like [Maniola jurtina]|uniref:protein eiger-like n=1 Tax=Maniola jurtina TaxID=191418 RepID=UPI001E68EDF3|nr:protein eiger-like [Maniola jurtina]